MTERGLPPIREIGLGNATEVERDDQGFVRPVTDGRDVPGWEYETHYTVGGQALRIPVGHKRNFDDAG